MMIAPALLVAAASASHLTEHWTKQVRRTIVVAVRKRDRSFRDRHADVIET